MGNKELTSDEAKQFFRELSQLMEKHKMFFFRCCYGKPIGFERDDDKRGYYFMYLDGYLEQAKTELKPCPFCGGEAWLSPPCNDTPDEWSMLDEWQAVCQTPGCEVSGCSSETKEECVEKWNRRVKN